MQVKGINLSGILSSLANNFLKTERRKVADGWAEISAAPGELSFGVVSVSGVVWRLNGVLASGGNGRLLKAAFRHPETGAWLDATPNCREWKAPRRKDEPKDAPRRIIRFLSLPENGIGILPADAPPGSLLTTLKIRWTPYGRVLFSLAGEKFGTVQPKVALDKGDPVTQWLDRALIEIGEDMKMSSGDFTRWCNYHALSPEAFGDLYHPEKADPTIVARADAAAAAEADSEQEEVRMALATRTPEDAAPAAMPQGFASLLQKGEATVASIDDIVDEVNKADLSKPPCDF